MLASVLYWTWIRVLKRQAQKGFSSNAIWFNEHLASRTGALPVTVSLLQG